MSAECTDVELEVVESRVLEVEVPNPQVIEVVTGQQGAPGPPGPPDHEYVDDLMFAHVVDPTPHPEYDDGPSLVLIFENGLI